MRLLNAIRGRGKIPPDPLVVPLGEGGAGRVEWRPSEGSGHLLVSGYTGSGKGVALLTILTHISRHPGDWQAYLIDPRGVEFRGFEEYPAVAGSAGDLEATGRVLAEVQAKMENRESGVEELRPRVLVMVDQVVQALDAGPALREPLEVIVEHGPAVGVHAVLATQRPDVVDVAGLGGEALTCTLPGGAATYRDAAGERELELYWTETADLDETLGETS